MEYGRELARMLLVVDFCYRESEKEKDFVQFVNRGFEMALTKYREILNEFLEKMIEEYSLNSEDNKYEPFVRLRYEFGLLRGVNVDLLCELVFWDEMRNCSLGEVKDFYVKNKEQMNLIVSGIEDAKKV